MKKNNIIYVISACIIVLCIIFALLIEVWGGFSYFVLSLLTFLALSWAGHLIYFYVTDFKEQLKEDFKYFKAEMVNTKNITSQEFDDNLAVYNKQFKKRVLKDKIINICKIVFCFGLALLFIIAMFV